MLTACMYWLGGWVLYPQSSDESRRNHWFSVYSDFFLFWGWGRPLNSSCVGAKTRSQFHAGCPMFFLFFLSFLFFGGGFLLLLLLFVFSGPHPQHMEVPRLGVELELQLPAYTTTAIAVLDLSCVCGLYHSSWQHRILNPLSEARDWTWVLMNASWVHYHGSTTELQLLHL